MVLKMNMREVRLAATGKHLFDAPYCYRDRIDLGYVVISRGDHCYYAPRDLTEMERDEFFSEIKRLNDEQEREWGFG